MNCVYTAIFGNYDKIYAPRVNNDSWDFILFTDNPKIKSCRWKTIVIDNEFGNIKSARKVKIMFHEYVKDYDISIWTDANILVNRNLNMFTKNLKDIITLKHPCRNNISAEADACISLRKDRRSIITRQMEKYSKEGYKHNNGLLASGLMVRRNNEKVSNLCDTWWDEVKNFSGRDQLSFNYALWKNPLDIEYLPFKTLGIDFKIKPHKRWVL